MMKLKIFVVVGLFIPAAAAHKYANDSWKEIMDTLHDNCEEVARDFPEPTHTIANHMLELFGVYSYQLGEYANNDNSTILRDGGIMLLDNLCLFSTIKDTREKMLTEFEKALPRILAGLRHVVSYLRCIIGKLTDNINDAIKCLERSLKHLLKDFLKNGVKNLSLGKKTDFEPVMKCLQKLANIIASIAETVLNDPSVSTNDVHETLALLTIMLCHSFVFVQGTKSTVASIIYSNEKSIPVTLNACLTTNDLMITDLTGLIRSLTNTCVATLRGLLASVVRLCTRFNETLEDEFGLVEGKTLSSGAISEQLFSGMSSIRPEFSELSCQNVKKNL